MISRRKFTQSLVTLSASLFFQSTRAKPLMPFNNGQWVMPDESAPHKCTWMSFIASYDIWAKKQIPEVHRNLADIAKTIAKYEPVTLLIRKQDIKLAKHLLDGLDTHKHPIELIEFAMNDLWMRDTGPAFVINDKGQKAAVNLNFNGWGGDQEHKLDAKVADFVALKAAVESIQTDIVLEGGCFEVDGNGTAIMTESCILNNNRNPNWRKSEVEAELKALLGLKKIIWLKGIKGKDITDGHTDFYARFAKPGTVVVSRDMDKNSYDYKITRNNIDILQSSTDVFGKPLKLVILDTPWDINTQFGTKDFAAGYVGYYVCNNAVILQKFGDKKADNAAKAKLANVFPNHTIEQIAIDGIASGGGSIHCATQQEPSTSAT